MRDVLGMFRPNRSEVFASGDARLRLHIVEPSAPSQARRPAILFFFGGGFRFGSARQFVPFCHAFAQQGFVALSAEYRVSSRHRTDARAAIADAHAALDWIDRHAETHAIDRDRIVVAGASAGGLLAASLLEHRRKPVALVLLNPLTDASLVGAPRSWRAIKTVLGSDSDEISPLHRVRGGAPATLILHGDRDRIIPISHSVRFRAAMLEQGNVCELESVRGCGHGFFNYGFGRFNETVSRCIEFLAEHDVLFHPGRTTPAGAGNDR